LVEVQTGISEPVGATAPIYGNPDAIALGEIRFVDGRQGGGSEKGGEQHQRRRLHAPLVAAIWIDAGPSRRLEVGAFSWAAFRFRSADCQCRNVVVSGTAAFGRQMALGDIAGAAAVLESDREMGKATNLGSHD